MLPTYTNETIVMPSPLFSPSVCLEMKSAVAMATAKNSGDQIVKGISYQCEFLK
jgi:hypothetical protein